MDVRNLESNMPHAAVLKLMGVGGGGCNAINHMIAADIHGLSFTCVNTDAQALANFHPDDVIQLGSALTRGLGAGADPQVGRHAAEEDRDRIAAAIGNADLLFLTAGMGGGTGTGAIPVVARIARELGVLTVAVVTRPFAFEGEKRRLVADKGINELRKQVDSLIVVPNENLLKHLGPNIPLIDAFAASNDILTNAVQSIAELITTTGLINVDFADVKSVMTEMGQAMMSTGRGIGECRARDAAIAAIESPLLDNIDLREARGILANVTASADLSMGEFQIVGDIIANITADDANVVIGTVFDQRMKDEMRVTVVATGLKSLDQSDAKPVLEEKRKRSFFGNRSGDASSEKASAEKGRNERTKSASSSVASAIPAKSRLEGNPIERGRQHMPAATKRQSAGEATFAKRTDAPSKKEICTLCDNPVNAHSSQCPLLELSSSAPAGAKSHFAGPRSARPALAPRRIEKAPIQKSKFTTGQKLNMAGLAAGVLALVAIFYAITGNVVVDGYNQIVGNEPDNSTPVNTGGQDQNSAISSFED